LVLFVKEVIYLYGFFWQTPSHKILKEIKHFSHNIMIPVCIPYLV